MSNNSLISSLLKSSKWMKCFFAAGGFASVGNADVLIISALLLRATVTEDEEDDEEEEDRIRCRDVCCFTLDEVPFL
jgi:hypothetical protein